jgi:hypothetical protein
MTSVRKAMRERSTLRSPAGSPRMGGPNKSGHDGVDGQQDFTP